MNLKKKLELRQKRVWRIRKKIAGTSERPRLCVTFTNSHIYAQAIDDEAGRTVFSVSTLNKDLRTQSLKPNREGAKAIGKLFGEGAKSAGINEVVFDRHGRLYHGRVREFAEAAREAGLQF